MQAERKSGSGEGQDHPIVPLYGVFLISPGMNGSG